MGWRQRMKKNPRELQEVASSVGFVGQSLISRNPKKPKVFNIGEVVAYRIPLIKTPTNYSWVWYHGNVQSISDAMQQIIVTPLDEGLPWRSVAPCYCNTVHGENVDR